MTIGVFGGLDLHITKGSAWETATLSLLHMAGCFASHIGMIWKAQFLGNH